METPQVSASLRSRFPLGSVETLRHRRKQGPSCSISRWEEPAVIWREVQQGFLQVKPAAQCVMFKHNHCFSARIPLFQHQGVEPKDVSQSTAHGRCSMPHPSPATPGTTLHHPVSIPSPSSSLPTAGTCIGEDLSVLSVKSSLTLTQGCFPAPKRTLHLSFHPSFVLLQTSSEADSSAAAVLL